MKAIESTYIKILSGIIELLHDGLSYVDPKVINNAKFYARALFIVYSYAVAKNNGNKMSMREIAEYMANRFGAGNLFTRLIHSLREEAVSLFDKEDIPACNFPIGPLYERLLSIETAGLEIRTGKEYRNKLGSYYTPENYAYAITRYAVDVYLRQNCKQSLKSAKIADFSCGCGIFLLSALNCLKTECRLSLQELKRVVLNLYACDVDPIALEIARISVLDFCNANEEYDAVSKHFIHANFLIHSEEEATPGEKLAVAMDGYIYHQSLAVGASFLQEYDIILGNPPWEKIRFEEKRFYSQYTEQIGYINFKFNLLPSIEGAKKDNPLIRDYAQSYVYQLELAKSQIKESGFFKDSTNGELNTCALFSDAALSLSSPNGSVGLFVKSSLVTAKVNKKLFAKMLPRITAVFDFINRNKIFEIDSRERFSIVVMGNRNDGHVLLGMNLLSLEEIGTRSEVVSVDVFARLNPETRMIPNLSSGKDIKLLSGLYCRFKTFTQVYPDVKYGRLVHLTNHIDYIDKAPAEDNIPVYEGKFFSLFDNRHSGFNGMTEHDKYKSKASSRKLTQTEKDEGVLPESRFYIKKDKWSSISKDFDAEYMVAWHSLTSATNQRTCVATLLPFIPGSQSVQFLTLQENEDMIYLTGVFNSVVFDYIVKCKLNGIDLTQAVVNQTPFPSKLDAKSKTIHYKNNEYTIWDIIQNIVRGFYHNDTTLKDIIHPERENELDTEGRSSLFMLLDAVMAHLYEVSKEELEYILSLFEGFYSEQERISIVGVYEELNSQ